MSPENRMEHAIQRILETAKSRELTVEVLARQGRSTHIGFNQQKMDQFSFSESLQLGVRLVEGRHEGVAYTEDISSESLDELLIEARENARMITRERIAHIQKERALPDQPELYQKPLDEVPVEKKIEAASLLETAALEVDHTVTVPFSRYSDYSNHFWIANTNGLFGGFRTNGCVGFTQCLIQDGDAAVDCGDAHASRSFHDLHPEAIARTTAEKALARRGAKRPATGRYTVVFENRVAENLIEMIANYFSAKAVDENISPLKGRLNQNVFSSKLTITDDPFYTAANGCRPFDSEGFPSQKTELVRQGKLASFLTNSVLAEKMNLPHTASAFRMPSTDLDVGITNLIVAKGEHELNELLDADRQVIYVTEISGMAGFRRTSGDFSLPMEGDLFENGKRSGALKDFVVSGNILELLANVKGVGSHVRQPIGNVVSPAFMVPNLNVAGVSQ